MRNANIQIIAVLFGARGVSALGSRKHSRLRMANYRHQLVVVILQGPHFAGSCGFEE